MLDKASGIEIGVVGLGPAVIPANRDESTSLVGRIPLRADERLGTSWVNGLPRDEVGSWPSTLERPGTMFVNGSRFVNGLPRDGVGS